MPFARAHQYLTISGTHFGAERFTFGLRLNNAAGSFPATAAAQQTLCDQYHAAVAAWWPTQTVVGSPARMDLVKLNAISPLGRYVHQWTNLKESPGGLAGGTQSAHAPQVALVATLESGRTRGMAARGRIFLPAPTFSVSNLDGRMSTTNRDAARTGILALINAINGVDPGRRVVIGSDIGTGTETVVRAISVGRVLDTMRSRRTSLAEERASGAVAGADGFGGGGFGGDF